MSGSGRAGNGRGNNRRRPFRRRDDTQQELSRNGQVPAQGDDTAKKGESSQKNRASERRARGRNSPQQPGRPRTGDTELSPRVQENSAASASPRAAGRSSSQEGNPNLKSRRHLPENQGRQNRGGAFKKNGENSRGERADSVERLKWVPPKLNTDPLPVPDCPWCGKPIRDLSSAITDKNTGTPVHFDCVAAKITGAEILEKGDAVTYIGGGRFGIVNFGGSQVSPAEASGQRSAGQDTRGQDVRSSQQGCRDFRIKKIIEWETTDKRAEWRAVISDHYSVT